MKRFLAIISICALTLSANAGEVSVASPSDMASPTDEINSSFSQVKETNWVLHRLKPTEKKKVKPKKSIKIPEYNEDDYITIKRQPAENSEQKEKKDDVTLTKKTEKTQTKATNKVKNNVKTQKVDEPKKPVETKEKVTETQPAEKVIKKEVQAEAKEEKEKIKQEEERRRYRELEELTETYQKGVALYNDNNIDEALNTFIKIPEDKRTPQIWLLMGNILMDKDKKDEAVFMYGRAILTDSTFYKAYYNLGNVYLNDDKFNMAIEQYKTAGRYSPNNPYIFYNLGCAYLKAGELRKAKGAFIRALEINNKVADFHYNLAYTYKKLGKEKLAKTYLSNYNKLTGEVD